MRTVARFLFLLLIVVGCENNSTAPEQEIEAELAQPCEDQPDLFDYDGDLTSLSAPVIVAGSDYVSIWRELIRPFDNSWFIDTIQPGLFEVTRYADITGMLYISREDSSTTEKPLFCHGTRRGVVSRPTRGTMGELVEVSGALIEVDGSTLSMERVEVSAGFGTRIFEDPLELAAFPEGLLHLEAGEEVTVRVYGPPDDAVVLLRTPLISSPFSPGILLPAEGYFEGTWTAPGIPGIYRAGVDVLSHETVYDEMAPYDCIAWIIPYVVR